MAVLFGLGIAAYALRWLWLAVIAVAMLLFAYSAARAHSWYPIECCSDRDCEPLPDDAVAIVAGGYLIKATGELIAEQEARQGKDEVFHVCRSPVTGIRLCFFKPYSGS